MDNVRFVLVKLLKPAFKQPLGCGSGDVEMIVAA